MPPPAVPESEEASTQQATQSTQPYSQPDPALDDHLWGFLLPCSPTLNRIDFWRIKPNCTIGRAPENQVTLPGMRISKPRFGADRLNVF